MVSILLCSSAIVIIVIVWSVLTAGATSDEQVQRMLLVREAQERFPMLRLSAALDRLYCETLREIRQRHNHQQYDTEELEERLILLFNERNYWLQQELDEDSAYEVQ